MNYADTFKHFVTNKLPEFHAIMSKWSDDRKPKSQRGNTYDSLTYFDAHFPRFFGMIESAINCDVPLTIQSICELGSWYPYTSYYWKHYNPNVKIDLFDIITRETDAKPYNVDGIKLHEHNLCLDPLPNKQYDLVIISEVLEHLPCNLFALCEDISKLVKPDGRLIVTYPLGGVNASGYEKTMENDPSKMVEGHLREFTEDTTGLFFKNMFLIGRNYITYPAYGRIEICVYSH